MSKQKKYKFSIGGKPLYPHLKLTRERFPRILATRIIADDDAEYFGAFLNRTSARMLLDFLNRTFRLRSCDIEIDGSFNYPCTMHYKRRCIAPCVRDLTDEEEYQEMVRLVRLFLLNDRHLFGSVVGEKVAEASDRLDFETAAKWRDILQAAEAYWADTRRSVWLDATSDSITHRVTEAGIDIILISQKGKRVLGERTFSFDGASEADIQEIVSEVIQQFYRFHVPKEIRTAISLLDRKELEKLLHERVGRKVKILSLTEKNRKVSTDLAVYRSSGELDVRRSVVRSSPSVLMQSLKSEFKLVRKPKRITAIDVSHISGTDQVAAAVSWADGSLDPGGSQYWLSDATSELGSVKRFVERVGSSRNSGVPEMLLIDGGPAQLTAAMSADVPENISIISAVKPAGEHESVSHFLAPKNIRVEFDITSESHRLLQRLRDEAHDYANAVHRDNRDYANYYLMAEMLPSLTETERRSLLTAFGSIAKVSLATASELRAVLATDRVEPAINDLKNYQAGKNPKVRPFVVPTRLQDEYGNAEDLRPIESRDLRR